MAIIIFLMIIVPLISSFLVNWTVNKYNKEESSVLGNAYSVAREALDKNGLEDVEINLIKGFLSDNYDDSKKCVNLSKEMAMSKSVSAIAIALHEVGHAIQYNEGYEITKLRSVLYPISSLGSAIGIPMIIIGLAFPVIGVIGFILVMALLLFQILTLPSEFDASRRALAIMRNEGLLKTSEIRQAKRVLKAAAFTYVASLFSLVAMLIFYKN